MGLLTDISPIMTSNTTPSPYVVSASSSISEVFAPWKVFDTTQNDMNSAWGTDSPVSAWIKLDFGVVTRVSAFSLRRRYSDEINAADISKQPPKDFKLYGSTDDKIYYEINEIDNEILWDNSELRIFHLNGDVTYRYFKLIIFNNNGFTSTTIGEWHFYQEELQSETPTIQYNQANLTYCLPSGTKQRFDLLSNDLRTGLLGYENDHNENYGSLRIIGYNGNAIIPKAGIKKKLIWSGTATSGTFENALSSFSSILFKFITCNEGYESFITDKVGSYTFAFSLGSNYCYGKWNITNDGFTLTIDGSTYPAWDDKLKAVEVYGIF